jgi:hypothetical protein
MRTPVRPPGRPHAAHAAPFAQSGQQAKAATPVIVHHLTCPTHATVSSHAQLKKGPHKRATVDRGAAESRPRVGQPARHRPGRPHAPCAPSDHTAVVDQSCSRCPCRHCSCSCPCRLPLPFPLTMTLTLSPRAAHPSNIRVRRVRERDPVVISASRKRRRSPSSSRRAILTYQDSVTSAMPPSSAPPPRPTTHQHRQQAAHIRPCHASRPTRPDSRSRITPLPAPVPIISPLPPITTSTAIAIVPPRTTLSAPWRTRARPVPIRLEHREHLVRHAISAPRRGSRPGSRAGWGSGVIVIARGRRQWQRRRASWASAIVARRVERAVVPQPRPAACWRRSRRGVPVV